jgi:2-amino-4-hydroxy-6-hydroxymethyldihydropteridine diphosphokinase
MILIALGSNLTGPWGTPRETLNRAVAEMPNYKIRVQKVSSFIETAPYGVTDQPYFLNAIARVKTALSPRALLQALQQIEAGAGRLRLERWGPRTLDLDIIDYNGLIRTLSPSDEKPLTLPHPGIAERSFVLEPLAEIAPRWKHPVTGKTAALTLHQLKHLKPN